MTHTATLNPIAKTRAYEQAADQISARIRDGAWRPGDRLPSERDLAHQLGKRESMTAQHATKTLSEHRHIFEEIRAGRARGV